MRIGVTGHRPDKLIGGWDAYENGGPGLLSFVIPLQEYFRMLGVTEVACGMAVGFDTMAALAVTTTGNSSWTKFPMRLDAYVPFDGHHKKWRQHEQAIFLDLLANPCCTVHVPESKPKTYQEVCIALNQRNRDIVDSGIDVLVALWNGTPGGTANCIRYANKKGVTVFNIWEEYSFLMKRELKLDDNLQRREDS